MSMPLRRLTLGAIPVSTLFTASALRIEFLDLGFAAR
jgi:hypothetical protein